jgi:hypothetical protein
MASKARARSRGKIGKGSRRRTTKKERFIAKKNTKKRPNYSTLTGRDAGIVKSQKKTRAQKIKESEQSVGSLDRRINKALAEGDTAQAKDLRSRLNKFTKDLGYNRAIEAGGVLKDKDNRIVRDSSGNPILTSKGRQVYDLTKDVDFIDPTRRLQNVYPDEYGKMYPISDQLQQGLPGTRIAKKMFGMEKDIPYRYPGTDDIFGEGAFPAQRYPLDYNEWWRQDQNPPIAAPTEKVTISDLVVDKSQPFDDQENKNRILESQGIDENFIYSGQDGEPGNTALQLAYDDLAMQELMKNIADHTDSEGRYTEKLPNPFFLDEEQKIKLREEADQNKRVLSDQEKQTLENKGISEHYLNMYPDTNLTEQSLSLSDTIDNGAINNLTPIPVEQFQEQMNANIEQGKNNLKEQYPYLNDAQIDNLYNYNMTGSLSDSLDSDPVVFDDYMTKRLF